MSKITAIEPLLARVGIRNQLLVKVTTDDGLVGWGESGLSAREDSVAATIRHFASFLVGKDSNQIGRIWQESYRSQYFEGGRVLTAAMSAIDIALYDILGKRLGVPVYQLLGGKQRDEIPTFPSAQSTDLDQLIAKARVLVDAGWDCLRIYTGEFNGNGEFDPRKNLNRASRELIALREEFGPDLCLGIDLHHRLSIAETADFCNRLPAGTLDFLEEPIRCETPEAYRTLRAMTNIPFAVGEEFASKWQAAPYIEQGLTQYMRLDICNIGGFTEAMKVAGWCERHYIDLMPHNPLGPVCTAATIHMAAAVPNFSWAETRQGPTEDLGFHDPELFPVQIPLEGITYKVPDRPGLGVEVDEDKIRATTPQHVEPPHLWRPDGSVTNW
ncbi:mandelate racemase/muconate lactonizing enzyme family protein [Mameliella alba]|nr:mandelate racemase/muconate lactonizing enzyme family protein [Mameliella alba]MBY6160270.1 mandelate racemase/muconate lactonizing enzyme family protein [Mameliella alba]MBY6168740.1 mandelate racemase/muconate lactonizing enzyme family protein [Mameliella alba]MBY6174039.1 mandelate racemase/muconate lactonizing enzyme family protein [Mameliella alba]MCA0956847.1 mandelate racemase/muconate lactonizing enzyme family protein [Mameliella alba]